MTVHYNYSTWQDWQEDDQERLQRMTERAIGRLEIYANMEPDSESDGEQEKAYEMATSKRAQAGLRGWANYDSYCADFGDIYVPHKLEPATNQLEIA